MKRVDKIRVIIVETFFVIFYILVFPYYFFNKKNHRKKIKRNPFSLSFHVKLASKYPLIYDLSMFINNFPYPICVYKAMPKLSGRVLQVGCGTGLLNKYYARHFSREDVEFVNLDVSERSLMYGKRHGRISSYVCGDITKIKDFDSLGKFDTIVFARSFHHIMNHKKALSNCEKLLNDNGFILIADIASIKDEEENEASVVNSSVDGVIWRYNIPQFKKRIFSVLPESLIVERIFDVRQINITNYNLKYPNTDIYAILRRGDVQNDIR